MDYSPNRLMLDPMVSEQICKVDDIFDSSYMDPRHMMVRISHGGHPHEFINLGTASYSNIPAKPWLKAF